MWETEWMPYSLCHVALYSKTCWFGDSSDTLLSVSQGSLHHTVWGPDVVVQIRGYKANLEQRGADRKMGYGLSEPQLTHSEPEAFVEQAFVRPWVSSSPLPFDLPDSFLEPQDLSHCPAFGCCVSCTSPYPYLQAAWGSSPEQPFIDRGLATSWDLCCSCLGRTWKSSHAKEGSHQFIDLQQMWCATLEGSLFCGLVEVQGKWCMA